MSHRTYRLDEFACPICGHTGDILEFGRATQVRQVFQIFHEWYDGGEEHIYLESDLIDAPNQEIDEYRCGNCDNIIASTEQEMINLLIEAGIIIPIPEKEIDPVNKVTIV